MLATGPGVHPGSRATEVVAHCHYVEMEQPDGHDDTMLDPEQRIWGFETNFGGLADMALVKANQLMPKPAHLTWEEAASPGLVNCTAYRQLVSPQRRRHEAGRQRPDLGRLRRPRRLRHPVRPQRRRHPGLVVSNEEKAAICRTMGAELMINRSEEGFRFWKDEHTQDPKEWKRFGAKIRELTGGEDTDIVFEHPGRETFGASVYVTRKGGTITTCASTSGYMHEYDNRYLWMNLKRIISSHFANYRESWEANRLIAKGKIHPTLSRTYPLEDVGQAALDVHQNLHQGKVGVLCLAPEEGLGVRDQEFRASTRRDQPLPRRLTACARPRKRFPRRVGSRAPGVCGVAVHRAAWVPRPPTSRRATPCHEHQRSVHLRRRAGGHPRGATDQAATRRPRQPGRGVDPAPRRPSPSAAEGVAGRATSRTAAARPLSRPPPAAAGAAQRAPAPDRRRPRRSPARSRGPVSPTGRFPSCARAATTRPPSTPASASSPPKPR